LVFHSSTITMMHCPINIRYTEPCSFQNTTDYKHAIFRVGECMKTPALLY